ncbi:hypothetical protein PVAG01_09541 [Phlyctema vagabunda]|uniref:Extracellular serine-rich protein n=1 Tax=Phlyctema vagabunda TaxID=108571 RepID=A0ABR4P7M9_9HELO
MLTRLLLLLALPTLIRAATHNIQVGNELSGLENLVFTPNVTTAAPGDTLVFHFYPGNHNVVQGQFDNPCAPSTAGFYSGYIDSESGEAQDLFTVTVNDTAPIWIYCSERRHCQNGMVAAINPPSQALDAYTAAAASVNSSSTPESVAGGLISTNPNITSAISSASPTSTPTATSSLSTSATGTETGSAPSQTNGGPNIKTGVSPENMVIGASLLALLILIDLA